MILRNLNKKLFVFITLSLFLMSTSGMIVFYHFCNHSHKMLVSIYIDATPELCEDYATQYNDLAHLAHGTCCHHNEEESHQDNHNCSNEHKSHYKTLKINTVYTFTNNVTSPKPVSLSVFDIIAPLETLSIKEEKTIFKELPPELPLYIFSGRDIITQHHSLKVYC